MFPSASQFPSFVGWKLQHEVGVPVSVQETSVIIISQEASPEQKPHLIPQLIFLGQLGPKRALWPDGLNDIRLFVFRPQIHSPVSARW